MSKMPLILDLAKAVNVPNTGTDQVSVRRDARRYNESFARRGSGVLGGDASPDDPDVGKKWRNSQDNDLDEELEEDRKLDSEIAAERGVTVKKDTEKAINLLTNLTKSINYELSRNLPNAREIEYLTELGHSKEDILKGLVFLQGPERSRFNYWLQDRLQKSVSKLRR